jgi:hypothetical protein
MRKAILAVGLCMLTMSAGLMLQPSFAQQRQGKEKERPRPPPSPRCPDLGLGANAFVTAIPGEAPLAEGEVALQWIVRNSGTAAYGAPSNQHQRLVIEYVTAAGAQQLSVQPLPATAQADGVILGPGETWRGYTRLTPNAEAMRRQWRLRLSYAGEERSPPNDCSDNNNRVMLPHP